MAGVQAKADETSVRAGAQPLDFSRCFDERADVVMKDRGQAQLAAHNGTAAGAEFQKFLDHRGIVLNFPLGALARLNLARAYAVSGDTNKSRTAYQDFFALWKDADPDIPILKEAKEEYAKLQ